jgi:hypothetical protein
MVLTCDGLIGKEGISAPDDIEEEFSHRPWQTCVQCIWDGQQLRLTLENDFDSSGAASLDEFWDAIHAYIDYEGEITLHIESVESF